MIKIILITGKGGGDFTAIMSAKNQSLLDGVCIKKVFTRNKKIELQCDQFDIESTYMNVTQLNKSNYLNLIYKYSLENNIDYILLCGFEFIIPNFFFEKYNNRIINSHHSILPANKGLFKKENLVESDQKLLGFTLHFIDDKVDEGEILFQAAFPNLGLEKFQNILSIYRFAADVMIVQLLRNLSNEKSNESIYSFSDIVFSPTIDSSVKSFFLEKHKGRIRI